MSTNRQALNAQDTGTAAVLITSKAPGLRVPARLAGTAATITSGYGGWEIIARVRQTAFVEWPGVEPRQMSLPLLLDGWARGTDQEPFIRNLERMGRPEPKAGGQPPTITVSGAIPAAESVPWVIAGIEWGDPVIRRTSDGHRVRQGVTLTLLEHVRPVLALTRSAAQRRALARARVTTITAREGDTMAKIAKRRLGRVDRWTEIRDLNRGIRDPRAAIKPGTKVRVPAS